MKNRKPKGKDWKKRKDEPSGQPAAAGAPAQADIWPYAILVVVLATTLFVRLRLLGVPLERDEGEYAYIGQQMLQGMAPYKAAYTMKFPGTAAFYAMFMLIFGQTAHGIHAGLAIVNLCSIAILFFMVKNLVGGFAAAAASSAFALLSVGQAVHGFAAHATHYVALAGLAGAFLLLRAAESMKKKNLFLSGMVLGLAPIMKQPGIFFLVFGACFLILRMFLRKEQDARDGMGRLGIFCLGGAVPALLMFLFLIVVGVFDKFWFWTYQYASEYGRLVDLKSGIANLGRMFLPIFLAYFLVMVSAGLGVAAVFIHPELRGGGKKSFILLFLIFSFLSVCPGLYFRKHYFVTLLPAVSILFGVLLDYLWVMGAKDGRLNRWKAAGGIIFFLAIVGPVAAQSNYLFKMSPVFVSQVAYGSNGFDRYPEIAKYISDNSAKDDTVAILGSEPQLLFYSRRQSATGHIYMYGLVDGNSFASRMQREMESEVEAAAPKFLIVVENMLSWLPGKKYDDHLFKWADSFCLERDYSLVGMVDLDPANPVFKWGEEAMSYHSWSNSYVKIFERR